MKKYLISAALLASVSGAAYAGGPTYVAPEPVPTAPVAAPVLNFGAWEGGYLGANVNWGKNPVEGFLDDPDGGSFALRGGYDWQRNRSVFGLGLEYDVGRLKGEDSTTGTSAKVGKVATLFGRAGYDAGVWMPYALVGYSWADAELNGVDASLDGYTVALGAERKFGSNWSGYGELSYTDFGDVEEFNNASIDSQKIKLGLNYRF